MKTPAILCMIAAPALAAAPPSQITAAGITLHSVSVSLPTGDQTFPGATADAINNNCLTCHSASMVLNQPALPRADWQAEVGKMRKTYKAPISDQDAALIVIYLAALKTPN